MKKRCTIVVDCDDKENVWKVLGTQDGNANALVAELKKYGNLKDCLPFMGKGIKITVENP